jgi:glutamine synthetase
LDAGMTNKEILKKIESHPGGRIKIAVADIDGVLRGKIISKDKFLKSLSGGLSFCDVVFGWDINDTVYENTEVTGWHTGYPDAMATPDPKTYRTAPWDDDSPFVLADFESAGSDISGVCPRTLLKQIKKECLDLDFHPLFAAEYEWYNFAETPDSLKEKGYGNLQPLDPGAFGYSVLRSSLHAGYVNDLFDQLTAFDVRLEGLHTETGAGIYEASIVYSDIPEAADRAVLFKTATKEIAYRHDIIASFMAKWNNDLPGCGGHIHQSLWDLGDGDSGDSKNLFFDAGRENNMSELMEQYIAGQLHCLPHILPIYAPSVNSYKRFVSGSWASTTVSWGIQNRTVALRVINPNKKAARVETRVPGADANPYLAMAASLASGLYGIKNEMSLEVEQTRGNAYDNRDDGSLPALPATLKEAIEAMKASPIAQELFGEAFTDHFIKTREWEWQQFSRQITDWEIERYLEII